MSKHGARSPNWKGFAECTFPECGCPEKGHNCIVDKQGFPPETGPDPRQPEKVSKQAVEALFDGAIEELEAYPSLRFTVTLLKKLRQEVKAL